MAQHHAFTAPGFARAVPISTGLARRAQRLMASYPGLCTTFGIAVLASNRQLWGRPSPVYETAVEWLVATIEYESYGSEGGR